MKITTPRQILTYKTCIQIIYVVSVHCAMLKFTEGKIVNEAKHADDWSPKRPEELPVRYSVCKKCQTK